MGSTGAMGFADAVNEGQIALRTAVAWNLQSNHYPPLPHELVDTALRAIELANDGDWDAEVECPENINFRGHATVPVHLAIETMHLDAFVDQGDEY